ncbi:MAG TPA: amidase [Rectinemataceae bacterium]|nr:amidase [Rectinemataceae bacterium]
MANIVDYHKYDGLGLAGLVQRGEVSALELVEEAIRRIEAHNPALNAVVTKLYDGARADAGKSPREGTFAGVPFLAKDLLATIAGVPTSCGNRLLKNMPASVDSELVRRWRKAGLIVVGKTNTPEFGLTPYTEPLAFGPTRNPWNLSRTPGGSSGGSAAAVAARIVPMASGGDGGGSIRIPASACGLFGMKPTRGRNPTGPLFGEAWHGFAIEHALTRSVRDSAALLDATEGIDIGAPYAAPPHEGSFLSAVGRRPGKLRIAFTASPLLGKKVDQELLRGLDDTVRLLEGLGHTLVEARPPVDGDAFSLAFITILAAELRADIEEVARAAGKRVSVTDFDPSTFGLGMLGKAMGASEYASAARYLQVEARKIAAFCEDFDFLLTPTLSKPPVEIGSLQPSAGEKALIRLIGAIDGGGILKAMGIIKALAAQTFEFIPWTPVFNVTGQPAMSVPLCWSSDGMPMGMHFVGRFGDEAGLFSLAGQLEEARPWKDRSPVGF